MNNDFVLCEAHEIVCVMHGENKYKCVRCGRLSNSLSFDGNRCNSHYVDKASGWKELERTRANAGNILGVFHDSRDSRT